MGKADKLNKNLSNREWEEKVHEGGMPMAAYRGRKRLQKGKELGGRMGREHSRWNNSMCKNMEYLGMLW